MRLRLHATEKGQRPTVPSRSDGVIRVVALARVRLCLAETGADASRQISPSAVADDPVHRASVNFEHLR
jgi:hypothetical protein